MNQTMTGMDFKIREVAGRIRELREISGFTVEEMAKRTDLSVEEFIQCPRIHFLARALIPAAGALIKSQTQMKKYPPTSPQAWVPEEGCKGT